MLKIIIAFFSILVIIGGGFIFIVGILGHQPRVLPLSAFTYHNATSMNYLESLIYGYGDFMDLPASCERHFKILGWDSNNQVYFVNECETNSTVVIYNPDQKHIFYTDNPHGDLTRLCYSGIEILISGIRPAYLEEGNRRHYVKQGLLLSPNQRWAAYVAKELFDGPQDVIIVAVNNLLTQEKMKPCV